MLKSEREKEFELRVFLRSYQDAATCVSQIASRKYSLKLYTDFIKILTTAVKRNQVGSRDCRSCLIRKATSQPQSTYKLLNL